MNIQKTALFLVLCCVLMPWRLAAQSEKVLFSSPGGFYEDTFLLELACFYPQNRIFYTLNGNTPTVRSNQYTDPLRMDASMYSHSDIYTIQVSPEDMVFIPDSVKHCIVIRAAVFDENDHLVSEVYTNSYFIRSLKCDTHGFPVVSICADSLDLFDYERGIMVPGVNFDSEHPSAWTGNYYMKGRDWERLSNVEFYELDNTGINQQAGLRTHGGNARRYPQKGFKIYAREEYGKKRFKHPFYESTDLESFKHLVLKPYRCAVTAGGMQDFICCQLARGLNFESPAVRPCVLFLNGEYWGIYYLEEKADERYLEDHFQVDVEQCDIICDWWPVTLELGSDEDYLALMDWLENADLAFQSNYEYLTEQIDLDCFIDYYAFELFINNLDWPANNVRFWRVNKGKWRWFFFDGDAGVSFLDYDVLAAAVYVGDQTWPSCTEATLFFRKLLENESFRNRFQQRFEFLLETKLSYDNTVPVLEYISEYLRPEIPNQSQRFQIPHHSSWWPPEITKIDQFLLNRPENLRVELNEFLNTYLQEPIPAEENFVCCPNPFDTQLKVYYRASEDIIQPLYVFDIMGRLVHTETIQCKKGLNEVPLELYFAPGIYVVQLGENRTLINKRTNNY